MRSSASMYARISPIDSEAFAFEVRSPITSLRRSLIMRTFECEYTVVDENDSSAAIRLQDIDALNEELGDDHFFATLESLIEFGTGVVIR
jgi:hypothetical protein